MSSLGPLQGWEKLLLQQVEQHLCLWFDHDKNFKNENVRKDAWREVSKNLNRSSKFDVF